MAVIYTELEACRDARAQFKREFRAMADGQNWTLYAVKGGVKLAPSGSFLVALVDRVQGLTEDGLVARLSTRLRQGTPHLWAQ